MLLWFGRFHLSRVDAFREFPYGNEYAKQVFTKTRFNELYACFHLVDNEKVPDKTKKQDAFWQIRPLIETLQTTFVKHFVPFWGLSIDEMTTPFKGKSRAKQYNPSKPNKWGFKDFALCCAKTGYCLFFYPYQGKDAQRSGDMSLAEFAVRAVLLPVFFHSNYHLAMDNWFTCWGAVAFIMGVGVQLVATLRSGRKGFPSTSMTDISSSEARGTCKVFGHRVHPLYVVAWLDNKLVRLVTTLPFGIGTCLRGVKDGTWQIITIAQPQLIGCYNALMGGCDKSDQHKAYIRPVIRSRVRMRPPVTPIVT